MPLYSLSTPHISCAGGGDDDDGGDDGDGPFWGGGDDDDDDGGDGGDSDSEDQWHWFGGAGVGAGAGIVLGGALDGVAEGEADQSLRLVTLARQVQHCITRTSLVISIFI